MKRSNIILLLLALISLTMFAVPDIFSMFSGQHVFYDQINCQKCHEEEYGEVWATSAAADAHIRAANNTNYTTYFAIGGIDYHPSSGTIDTVEDKIWTWNGSSWINDTESRLENLDADGSDEIDGNEICHLCHNSSLADKHSHALIVRTCDDDWCHGNRNYTFNDPQLFDTLPTVDAGNVLNESGNLHGAFYLSLVNEPTGFVAGEPFNHTPGNLAGDYTSKSYLACISCHSTVPIDITIAQSRSNHTGEERRKYS